MIPPEVPNDKDSRLGTRKKIVNGRLKVSTPRGLTISGKLTDISLTGIGAILENPIDIKAILSLECDLYTNGLHITLKMRAVVVHCVLTSGMGYRAGFQFESLDGNSKANISKLLS